MKYSSLNHNSSPTSFMKAVINGLAPDRGLYFPQEKVILSKEFIESIKNITSSKGRIEFNLIYYRDFEPPMNRYNSMIIRIISKIIFFS